MLPVLKTSIEATELSYFRDKLMPLADALGAKGVSVVTWQSCDDGCVVLCCREMVSAGRKWLAG